MHMHPRTRTCEGYMQRTASMALATKAASSRSLAAAGHPQEVRGGLPQVKAILNPYHTQPQTLGPPQ